MIELRRKKSSTSTAQGVVALSGVNELRSVLIYSTYFLLTTALGVIFVLLEDLQSIRRHRIRAALIVQTLVSPLADRKMKVPLAIAALGSGVIGPLGLAYGGVLR